MGVHVVATTVTAMIRTVVTTTSTVTVIKMTTIKMITNTIDRAGLQMKRLLTQGGE